MAVAVGRRAVGLAVADQDQGDRPWRWLWRIRTRAAGYLSGCAADACGDGGELPIQAGWLPCRIISRCQGKGGRLNLGKVCKLLCPLLESSKG